MTPAPSPPIRRTHALTTAAAVVALAACSSPGASPPEPDAATVPQPRVLFQSNGPEHILVGVGAIDGSDVTHPLADLPGGHQMNPDWSPDGSQVVLAVNDGRRDDLWVSEVGGGGARVLLDCERTCRSLDDPSWSPDGSSIVYSRTVARGRTGWGSLEEVDVATGEVSVILAPRVRTFTAGARWSPDGSRIVFEDVHKAGAGSGRRDRRGVPADRGSARGHGRTGLDGAGASSRPPPTGVRTARRSSTPRWRGPTPRPRTSSSSRPQAASPVRSRPSSTGEATHSSRPGGPTARTSSSAGSCPTRFEDEVLLTVSLDGLRTREARYVDDHRPAPAGRARRPTRHRVKVAVS